MLASRRFTVSEPFLGPITGQWVVAQIHPRFDRDGRVVGGVGIPLDLEALQSLLERGAGVARLGARVVSADGRIIASSRLPEEPLGRDISNEPLGRALRGSPPPRFSATGLGGTEQVFGATPVPGTGWVMVVGEDRSDALGPAYEGLRNGALALIVALTLAALATAALARRIAEPVRNLAQVAARIAAGEHGARAPASGPGEIAHVAREFNRMLERREAAEAERFALLERISDGFVGLDRDWNYVYINRKGAELLGRTPEQLIGKHIWTEFPDGVGQPFHLAYERAMREQTPIRIEEYYPPFGRWFENRIYPSKDGLSIFYSDITDLKLAERALREARDRLQALSRKVLAAQEEERARIARELHDEVGQALTAVKLNLQGLRRGRSEASGEALADSLAVIDRTIHDVRALSLDLRPQILDDLGLLPTLKWYCERQSARAGVPISLEAEPLGRDEAPEFATACYRIVQEAVTNALRHAEAKHISVALRREGERIGLSIGDDGRGFDVQAARAAALGGRSSGLTGIFERAELAGGSAVVESAAGQGTRVRIEFPAEA
jgi:PAS domain S-box-containing protein